MQANLEEQKQFNFGVIVWHEVESKIITKNLRKAFNEKINLEDFGKGINAIYFVFIAVKPTNLIHQEELHFDKKTKELEIRLKLDYSKIKAASKEIVQEQMRALFLKGIEKMKERSINDFDIESYQKAVEKLFEEAQWMNEAA